MMFQKGLEAIFLDYKTQYEYTDEMPHSLTSVSAIETHTGVHGKQKNTVLK